MDYYRSHWVDIDEKRLKAYDEGFKWSPMFEPFLNGIPLDNADLVVDFGCGPGHITLEMARRMKAGAKAIGCDINEDMLKLAEEHAVESGLADKVFWHHTVSDRVPLDAGSADVVFCKNTLIYLSLDETLEEFRRVLKPGGMVRLADVDWHMIGLEPLGPERFGELLKYAEHAFKDSRTGSRMYGAARKAGFAHVDISVAAIADTKGFLIPLSLVNLVTYALDGGYPKEKGDTFLADTREALEKQEYLMVVPIFIVTGIVPEHDSGE